MTWLKVIIALTMCAFALCAVVAQWWVMALGFGTLVVAPKWALVMLAGAWWLAMLQLGKVLEGIGAWVREGRE